MIRPCRWAIVAIFVAASLWLASCAERTTAAEHPGDAETAAAFAEAWGMIGPEFEAVLREARGALTSDLQRAMREGGEASGRAAAAQAIEASAMPRADWGVAGAHGSSSPVYVERLRVLVLLLRAEAQLAAEEGDQAASAEAVGAMFGLLGHIASESAAEVVLAAASAEIASGLAVEYSTLWGARERTLVLDAIGRLDAEDPLGVENAIAAERRRAARDGVGFSEAMLRRTSQNAGEALRSAAEALRRDRD